MRSAEIRFDFGDFILPIIHGFDDIRGNLYWTDPALDEPVPFGPLRFADFN